MKQRTMLYLFTLSAVMVSATVYAGETKPERREKAIWQSEQFRRDDRLR